VSPSSTLATIMRPGKVIAVGRNYAAHAKELGNAPAGAPFFFLKAPSTAIGNREPIVIPFDVEGEVHHEAELAVVIGQAGRRIPRERALAHVLGYCCANDVTARTEQKSLQERKLPWFGGKNADSFLVLGPGITLRDMVPDPAGLRVRCFVDGQARQDASTGEMIHGVAELIAHASRRLVLEPGDVLLTGTPAGVGPIRPGQIVEVRIDGLGSLINPVVLEERPA
jgi:2-keto-4-pentenoate hydratase/2-oxohepta-3-ene-1,7-dioic acid hydratase in catechol pathway